MSHQHFLDLLGITNLVPGPNSTEMAIHCGYHRAGWKGLIVAGVCFILPSVLLTMIFAYLFIELGRRFNIEAYMGGIHAAVLVVILFAVYRLGKKTIRARHDWLIAGTSALTYWLGVSAILSLLAGALIGIVLKWGRPWRKVSGFLPLGIFSVFPQLQTGPWLAAFPDVVPANMISLGKIFGVFLKIGCVLFGSGYVLVAYVEHDLIHRLGWLTEVQLLDAVAIGQFTPGPVLSTAAFIGYQLSGFKGAIVASLAIFLPSFVIVLMVNPFVKHIRNSEFWSKALDAVNASVIGLMAAVLISLGTGILADMGSLMIFIICLVLVVRFPKVSSITLVAVGLIFGIIFGIKGGLA